MSTATAADSAIPAPRSKPARRRSLYRGDPGMWSWVLHRITGATIFFFLLVHVLDTALVRVSPEAYNSIIETLHIFEEAKCYDPRDRLYALLSMGWGPGKVSVDYTTSVEDVYTNFASTLLRATSDDFLPAILASASCRRDEKPAVLRKLPSWSQTGGLRHAMLRRPIKLRRKEASHRCPEILFTNSMVRGEVYLTAEP